MTAPTARDLELTARADHRIALVVVDLGFAYNGDGSASKAWVGQVACTCGWGAESITTTTEGASADVRGRLDTAHAAHVEEEVAKALGVPTTGSQVARLHLALEVIAAHVNAAVLRMDADAPDEVSQPLADLARRVGLESHHAQAGHPGPRSIDPDGMPACQQCTDDLITEFAGRMTQ